MATIKKTGNSDVEENSAPEVVVSQLEPDAPAPEDEDIMLAEDAVGKGGAWEHIGDGKVRRVRGA